MDEPCELCEEVENPGNIFRWRDNLVKSRSLDKNEVNLLVQHSIDFFCNSCYSYSADKSEDENYLFVMQNCPTKFLTYHCVKAVELSLEGDFSTAIDLIRKQKCLIILYKIDLEELYDTNGFLHLLNTTAHEIVKIQKRVESGQANGEEVLLNESGHADGEEVLMESGQENGEEVLLNESEQVNGAKIHLDADGLDCGCSWSKLSIQAQSIILSSKLYYWMLVREPVENVSRLSSQVLSLANHIPEWHYISCKVQSRQRFEDNLPVVKPEEEELNILRKALQLQPSNLLVWTLIVEVLFDFIRTDERTLESFNFLGENFNSVDSIMVFMHHEIKQLMEVKDIPKFLWLEINSIACRFYGYRNLREMKLLKDNKVTVILSKSEAKRLTDDSLSNAVMICPESGDVNLIKAFQHLKKFERENALMSLNCALKADPLNYSLIVIYFRILVGGILVVRNEEQRNEAIVKIGDAFLIAQRHKWPLLVQVHLLFLRGCLFCVDKMLNEWIRDWIEGLYLHDTHFLNQFFYWSKTQVRKYMWPHFFTNFQNIEVLKDILSNLAKLKDETDQRIPVAADAFRVEIENSFPVQSKIAKEVAKLRKKWYYLINAHDVQNGLPSDNDEPLILLNGDRESSTCSANF